MLAVGGHDWIFGSMRLNNSANSPTVTTAEMLMHDSTEDGIAASPFLSKAQVLQARRAVIG